VRGEKATIRVLPNRDAMLALWFCWYNYCRKHMTIKTTPAVAAAPTIDDAENHAASTLTPSLSW
jgi:transposase InsO family protein